MIRVCKNLYNDSGEGKQFDITNSKERLLIFKMKVQYAFDHMKSDKSRIFFL